MYMSAKHGFKKQLFEFTIFVIILITLIFIIFLIEKQSKKLREDKTILLGDLDTIEQKETALVATLQTKYGTGAINPETGDITPAQ